MNTTPRIHLVIEQADGRKADAIAEGTRVTAAMLDVADDLLTTLTTGERPPIKGLYDLCAKAFGTTREDAKNRLTGAMYGWDKAAFDQRQDQASVVPTRVRELMTRETLKALHQVVIGLGGDGFSARCSCGWRSADDNERNHVATLAAEHIRAQL